MVESQLPSTQPEKTMREISQCDTTTKGNGIVRDQLGKAGLAAGFCGSHSLSCEAMHIASATPPL